MPYVFRDEEHNICGLASIPQIENHEFLNDDDKEILNYQLFFTRKSAKQKLSSIIEEFFKQKILLNGKSWKVDQESQFNILGAIDDFDAVLSEQKAFGYIPADSIKIAWSSTGLISKEDLIDVKNEVRRRKSIILGKVKLQLESEIDKALDSDDINKIVDNLDLNKFL